MAKRSFYVKDSELDDYQVKVINKKTDNSYIVKGCAGSGKSILALWKAKQIQEEHKGSYLYIVKTKALRQYMNDGIQQVGLAERNVVDLKRNVNDTYKNERNYAIKRTKLEKYLNQIAGISRLVKETENLLMFSKILASSL